MKLVWNATLVIKDANAENDQAATFNSEVSFDSITLLERATQKAYDNLFMQMAEWFKDNKENVE